MFGNPLLHLIILGHTGRYVNFAISRHFFSRFQGMAAFAASATAYHEDDFVHFVNSYSVFFKLVEMPNTYKVDYRF
jgi:hypothetical protein